MASLHWIGKEAVVGHHREVPYHLLRADPALSVGNDGGVGSGNLPARTVRQPHDAARVRFAHISPKAATC